jgi:hypothetical protein
MKLIAKLCAASVACAMLGPCVGMASPNPWRLGKNKLPRLSSQGQNIAIEHIKITTSGVSAARKRHKP